MSNIVYKPVWTEQITSTVDHMLAQHPDIGKRAKRTTYLICVSSVESVAALGETASIVTHYLRKKLNE